MAELIARVLAAREQLAADLHAHVADVVDAAHLVAPVHAARLQRLAPAPAQHRLCRSNVNYYYPFDKNQSNPH